MQNRTPQRPIPHLDPTGAGGLPTNHAQAMEWRRRGERANQATHFAGLVLSAVGAVFLCRHAGQTADPWRIVGCWVYSVTLVALYAASTLSHSFERVWLRHFFRTVDQVCIFFLIAGTFTPFGLMYLRDPWALSLLGAVWVLAFAGVACKLFYTRLGNVSTIFYVLLGWLPMLAIRQILLHVPLGVFAWILAGGVFYTGGVYFLLRDERRLYYHAAWHLMVIAGSACHYLAVLFFVAGWRW